MTNRVPAGLRDRVVRKSIDLLIPSIRCPLCGFPIRVATSIRWRRNGTISPTFTSRYMRVVIIHTGVYDRLFDQIEKQLGISIEHILFEAQRNISRSLFEAFERVLPVVRVLKKVPVLKRIMVEGFNKIGTVSGMGHAITLEYVAGQYAVGLVKNPYNVTQIAANGAGALEFLEGLPFSHKITSEGDNTYTIRSSVATDRPALSMRLTVPKPDLVPGHVKYERCPLCRAPKVVSSRFEWIDDEGKIVDKRSNTRTVMIDAFLVKTVFRELAKELGDEVYSLLIPAQCDWTMEHVELLGIAPGKSALKDREFEEAFKGYLEDLPIFGYGNPVSFEIVGPRVEVVIENPFQEEEIAGTLQGLYQIFSGCEGKVSWVSKSKGTAAYTIEPA